MDQKIVDFVYSAARNRIEYAERNNAPPAVKELITQLQRVALGEIPLSDAMLFQLQQNGNYYAIDFLEDLLNRSQLRGGDLVLPWTIDNDMVRQLIKPAQVTNRGSLTHLITSYVARTLTRNDLTEVKRVIDFLLQAGFDEEWIAITTCTYSQSAFCKEYTRPRRRQVNEPGKNLVTGFAEYLLPRIQPRKGFLGFGKDAGLKKALDVLFLSQGQNENRYQWVMFLYENFPEGLEDTYHDYLWYTDYNQQKLLDFSIIHFLIDRDPLKFERAVIEALDKGNARTEDKFSIFVKLNAVSSGKYDDQLIGIGEAHLNYFCSTDVAKDHYYHDPGTHWGPLTQAYTEFLWKQSEEKAIHRIDRFMRESTFLPPHYFEYLDGKLEDRAVPFLMEALLKNPSRIPSNARNFYPILFTIFDKYYLSAYVDQVIEFMINHGDKKSGPLASKTLSKYVDQVVPKATALLSGKTVDHRVSGALMLAAISLPEVGTILNDAVDQETNDDTRDIMLDALKEKRFAVPYSLAEVRTMINQADARKKMNKWTEKWLAEENVPRLYWNDSTPLEQRDIRFLMYRMKRAQGLNSDIEARQLINQLDKERSESFGKAVVNAFQDSNADSKLKYYLTLAGLLGGDNLMSTLHALFKKSIADKRVKMAEYVIGALAMVGSDKALRIVESIYRKFASKKPAISLAAQEALTAAASEYGITMDELADRIIPNFDFEGLYKIYTIDGESYRAFINAEFKLNYFTDDNKLRKSLPSAASKELKAEVKEIEKEINDVIKTQTGRLEKYMLDERKWNAENWRTFFYNNPIMFVYAMRVVWGMFDNEGKLINSFYCSEDASLYTVTDDEIELEDQQFVGIVHPIHLTAEQLVAWKDKLYTMSMTTLFPILERAVFLVDNEEKELSYSRRFSGLAVPKGADFVNTFMVKQNWLKSSGDGGRSEFTKHFKDGRLKAYANIDGPAACYQGGTAPAKVFEISFMGKNWSDKIALKDVPPVFYSEVMWDIDQLIKAS